MLHQRHDRFADLTAALGRLADLRTGVTTNETELWAQPIPQPVPSPRPRRRLTHALRLLGIATLAATLLACGGQTPPTAIHQIYTIEHP